MSYYLIFTILAAFVVCAFSCYKIVTTNTKLYFLQQSNEELIRQYQLLQQEHISNIKVIEQLNSRVGYLNQILSETEKAKTESFNSAKAALFELGSELSRQLIAAHKQESQEVRQLSEQNIAKTSERFNSEFERLVSMISSLNKEVEQSKSTVDIIKQSLLSPSGAGKLAEITLENILKSSGLRVNLDFTMQYNVTGIDQSKLRPDAVIFLPAGNIMIIDAKASKFLVDSYEYGGENLAKTMNTHLKSLNSKEYAENILSDFQTKNKNFGNIITLMFLPTEHAVEKILEADNNFMNKAWAANIFPVGPTGLMNMLSFAKFQISDYMRSENHKLIIDEVRKLLISVNAIAEHSQKLGNNLQSAVANYDKFAGSFNRNLLVRARNMQKLGVEIGAKQLPQALERYEMVSSKLELVEADSAEIAELKALETQS